MKTGDIEFIMGMIVCSVILYFVATYSLKVRSNKWRLCYAIPFGISLFFAGIAGFDLCMISVYIGVALLLVGFVKESVKLRKGLCIICALSCVVAFPVCASSVQYRGTDYLADFEKGFSTMKEHYILGEYKEIDWDHLYETYQPKFKEVTKTQDKVENFCLWQQFCQEFHDGHVSFTCMNKDVINESENKMAGLDYGLSMVRLSDDRFVAVNVAEDSEAAKAGIALGTEIVAWNGESPAKVEESLPYGIEGFAVKENEDFYNALMVAGQGQQEVEVTFINDEGSKQSVTLAGKDSYYNRLDETLKTINQKVEQNNLEWKEIDETTACLSIDMMMYDTDSYEETYNSSSYNKMKSELHEAVAKMKDKGIKNVVMDLRNNSGGSPHFIMHVAAIFAPAGSHSYVYDGVWDRAAKGYVMDETTGKPAKGEALTYEGEGLFDDGQIIILTNGMCVSAGDHLINMLSQFDNVTVMGFTPSNNSGQAVSGVDLVSGSLGFSACPAIGEDGDFYVDTDASRTAKVKLDIQVPFDEEVVRELFQEKQDALLNRAILQLQGSN